MVHPNEIHISGPPGSGKSYLGDRLRNAGLFVVDMDDFFQPGDGRWEKLEELRRAQRLDKLRETWHEMKREQFAYYRSLAPSDVIIWVGLTDHAAPPNEPPYNMDVGHRFYIDITDFDLCRQYYTRLVRDTANTDWLFVPSSSEIVQGATLMKHEHISRGYILLTQEDIEQRILTRTPSPTESLFSSASVTFVLPTNGYKRWP